MSFFLISLSKLWVTQAGVGYRGRQDMVNIVHVADLEAERFKSARHASSIFRQIVVAKEELAKVDRPSKHCLV